MRHALAVMEMRALGCRPVEIVALCDSDIARRDGLAASIQQAGAGRPALFTEVADLLASPDIDAVDIVLPTFLHHGVILEALEAGKHVLVEKPLALTVKACDLIVSAAARSGRVVAISENYRRIASNRAFGHMVRSGQMGTLDAMFVRNIASPDVDMKVGDRPITPPAWYRDRTRAGGYHVLEMGVHEVDLQHYWFGDIDTVSAETRIFDAARARDPRMSEDMATASLHFASGFVSHITFSSAMPGIEIADRLLVGRNSLMRSNAWHAWQDGDVILPDGARESVAQAVQRYLLSLDADERQRLLPQGTWEADEPRSIATRPLTYGVGVAIHDFARAVRGGGTPEITPETARLAVATCYAIQESAALERPVRLRDVLSGELAQAQRPLNEAIGLG